MRVSTTLLVAAAGLFASRTFGTAAEETPTLMDFDEFEERSGLKAATSGSEAQEVVISDDNKAILTEFLGADAVAAGPGAMMEALTDLSDKDLKALTIEMSLESGSGSDSTASAPPSPKKPKAADADLEADEDAVPAKKPKKAAAVEADETEQGDEDTPPVIKSKKAAVVASDGSDETDQEATPVKKSKKAASDPDEDAADQSGLAKAFLSMDQDDLDKIIETSETAKSAASSDTDDSTPEIKPKRRNIAPVAVEGPTEEKVDMDGFNALSDADLKPAASLKGTSNTPAAPSAANPAPEAAPEPAPQPAPKECEAKWYKLWLNC